MAALIRGARFCTPSAQVLKVLRCGSPVYSQASSGLRITNFQAVDHRSWLSTLAEEVVASPDAGPSKVDSLLGTVDRYMRQFGRISRKQLDPIVASLDQEGKISLSNSLSLLRLYGSALFDETPTSRLKLADELWEKYKKYGVELEVSHYNTLLAVYNQNKLKFSPTDFLESMKANGITPNRVTYQRLITRFCDEGDIKGATQVLEHMKSESMPINDQVFNSFIIGHLHSNDAENARNILEVMRQAGLDPTNTTYMTLAIGFAERGEMEEVKKYIKQAEVENVPLRPGQILEVYTALAMNGHHKLLEEVFPLLLAGSPFNQDAVRVCNQLIAVGQDEAAYKLFLEMPKPTRVDVDQTTLGRFFLRALAKHARPVEKVSEYVKDMQTREINKDDLSAVAQLAYLERQPVYALSVIDRMKTEGLPIRAHYFWPAFCHFRETKDSKAVYEAVDKMVALSDSKDDFMQSLHRYIIPGLQAAGQADADIRAKLQKSGFEGKEINFAFFLHLLDKSKLKEAKDFLEKNEVAVVMASVKACMYPLLSRPLDWHTVLPMLMKLKEGSPVWRAGGMETTALVLKQVLVAQRKADWAETQELFEYMADNKLMIMPRSHTELSEYFAGAPSSVLQALGDLVNRDNNMQRDAMEPLSDDLTLQELKQLREKSPNNKTIQKRLLIKACSVGEVAEVEALRSSLEVEGFVFPPMVLAQLSYLYSMFAKDVEKAQDYLQRLETQFPEHFGHQSAVLKLAALHASKGSTEAAVDLLQRYADKHMKGKEHKDVKKWTYYSDIITNAPDLESSKKLFDTMIACGYGPPDVACILDAYMDKVVENGDGDKILQEFEDIAKTHNKSPRVDKVLQFFIKKEDPDRLQKVVDLLTGMHGLMNVFHHLIADFVECGDVKKARKIMETPGLRANMQRLNYYCQSFIERDLIKELEQLVEVTKDMFGVDRDNMLFHLIRGYVKQKDLQKAQDVLVQYEEEMIQPSARTLRFLARSLEKEEMPVPFEVPEFQPAVPFEKKPVRSQKTKPQKVQDDTQDLLVKGEAVKPSTVKPNAAIPSAVKPTNLQAEQLKETIEKGDVEKVLVTLQSVDKSVLSDAINRMKKPWPMEALQSIFGSLGKQGDMETLNSVIEMRLPLSMRSTLRANIFIAAINSGKAGEIIDQLEGKVNSARYLTFPALDALHNKHPDLLDRVENIAKKLKTEKNYLEPLSILWCYYKYTNSPRAEEILKENEGFQKSVLAGLLCQAAVKENKVDVIESVLKLKKDVDEKNGLGMAYSHMLQLYVNKADVGGVEKTFDRIIKDEIPRSILRKASLSRAEALLQEKGKPLPALAGVEESSDSDSSSSSDEEKTRKR